MYNFIYTYNKHSSQAKYILLENFYRKGLSDSLARVTPFTSFQVCQLKTISRSTRKCCLITHLSDSRRRNE